MSRRKCYMKEDMLLVDELRSNVGAVSYHHTHPHTPTLTPSHPPTVIRW